MIGIIGAGISGLSLAYHLQKKNIPYFILEEGSFSGGYMQSQREGNYVFEKGPNSLLCDKETLSFLKELGLEKDIIPAAAVNKKRYIYKEGRYQKLPSGPVSLLTSGFFSAGTKWKILTEPWRKKEYFPKETLTQFFTRRFGKEVSDYAVNPFVTGIYAGSADELLTEYTFPSLTEFESKYGSVLKGLIKTAGQRKQSVNFKGGMYSLIEALEKNIHHLHKNVVVEEITCYDSEYVIRCQNEKFFNAQQLVLTVPAFKAAPLLETFSRELSEAIKAIEYSPMLAVHSVYKKSQIGKPLNGFGGLHPVVEQQFTAGNIWVSNIFEGKCPEDETLITSFVGGTNQKQNFYQEDSFLYEKVHSELAKNFRITGKPMVQQIFRWEKAIPQYNKNITEAWQLIPAYEHQGFHICANWYKGISLVDGIKKGRELAQKISEKRN